MVLRPPRSTRPDTRVPYATLFRSLLLHGMLILGVGFALDDAAPVLPTLDVILTQTQTELTPEQADFLAQANNQGCGEHDKTNRPREAQARSEEHTSELQSLMRISYAVFCLKKKNTNNQSDNE